MAKQNCWQVKRCGREPGGAHVGAQGACPAATTSRFAGIHGGQNSGRCCWLVANTLCDGKVQGVFAIKLASCMSCDFYKKVNEEEASSFLVAKAIFDKRPA
jgi:hypothetical protein